MNNEEQQLKKRFAELAERADTRRCAVWSDFLTLAEQDMLLKMRLSVPVMLYGGCEAAERRMARFGEPEETEVTPVVCIRIVPVSKKFAEPLSHRDILGALMSLGLRREVLGDIILTDSEACLFCAASVAGYIVGQLEQIRRTSVRCNLSDSPSDIVLSPPEERVFIVASERLDALIAAVYTLSRAESQDLIVHQRVFINGRMTENTSVSPKEGDIVSVRGFGRFVYFGVRGETKKGRLRVAAGIYQ